MSRVVEIVDTTTRDGNQSLWSATGLTTADIVAIAPTIERVGFRAVDFTSSTHMAVAVRFHREDPWERLRLVRAAMPETKLSFITSGMRFITWVPGRRGRDAARVPVRRAQRDPALPGRRPVERPGAAPAGRALARQEGVEEIVLGLTYSISDVHTHAYYAERAAALADCAEMDAFYLKDPGGLLTPDAVRELAPHFLAAAGERPGRAAQPLHDRPRPVRLHGRAARGVPGAAHRRRRRSRAGTSNPAVETTLRDLEAEGYAHRLDLDALAAMAEHFRAIGSERGLPVGTPQEFDATYYRHQLAGGMVSTTRRMLDELRRPELFDAALEEVGRVRAEMGYPIIVTPVSQLVATQAVRNVIDAERWSNVSDETIRYFLGHYGEPAAPVAPEVAERVLSLPAGRGAAPSRAAAAGGGARPLRPRHLRRGAPPAADDAGGAGRRDARVRAGAARCERRLVEAPSGRDAAARGREAAVGDELRVRKGDELVEWRRAT